MENKGTFKYEIVSSKPEEIGKRRPTGFVFNPPPIEDYEEHPNEDSMRWSVANKEFEYFYLLPNCDFQ